MAEKINVRIRGQKYLLRGDDENMIRSLADEVDSEIKSLETSHSNQPSETVAVLAALNIAEKRYVLQKQMKIDEDYLVNELDRMAKFLADGITNETNANVR